MSLLQLDAMISESGLDGADTWPTGWVEDLGDELAPLTGLQAPAPSAALLAAFGEAGPATVLPRRRVTGSRSTVASVLVLAVSTVGATGLSAAANTLPPALQRNVSDFSRHYLPFEFPQPHQRAAGRPDAVPAPPVARHPLTGRPDQQPATHHLLQTGKHAHEQAVSHGHHLTPVAATTQGGPSTPTPAHAVHAVHAVNGNGQGNGRGQQQPAPQSSTPSDPGSGSGSDSDVPVDQAAPDGSGPEATVEPMAAPAPSSEPSSSPAAKPTAGSPDNSNSQGNGHSNGQDNGQHKGQQNGQVGGVNRGQAVKAEKAAGGNGSPKPKKSVVAGLLDQTVAAVPADTASAPTPSTPTDAAPTP